MDQIYIRSQNPQNPNYIILFLFSLKIFINILSSSYFTYMTIHKQKARQNCLMKFSNEKEIKENEITGLHSRKVLGLGDLEGSGSQPFVIVLYNSVFHELTSLSRFLSSRLPSVKISLPLLMLTYSRHFGKEAHSERHGDVNFQFESE